MYSLSPLIFLHQHASCQEHLYPPRIKAISSCPSLGCRGLKANTKQWIKKLLISGTWGGHTSSPFSLESLLGISSILVHTGPARWLPGNYHHLSQMVSACPSAPWGIHHALLTWRGPHLVYVPGHADKSPGYHGEHSAEDSIPWQQGGGALPGLYTHRHPGTNPPGRLNHLERRAPSWASRAFLRVPWPSYQVLCHAAATRPPGQQPSRCQANFSTQPGFLSAPDRHHVSQQENTHSSTLQNAPDVIKAREAKETKDGLFGRGRS